MLGYRSLICATIMLLPSTTACGRNAEHQDQIYSRQKPLIENRSGEHAQMFVYRGAGCTGRSKIPAFASLLGRQPDGVVDFAQQDSWEGMLGSIRWSAGCWRGQSYQLAQSVPMLVGKDTTLAQGAAGAYDRYFEEFAKILIERGHANAYLRIGWEFNGGWYPWAASRDPEAFKAYFKRIAAIFRRAKGAQFQIVWNPAEGKQQIEPDTVYPGDDAVDIVALDLYNASWRSEDKSDPELRWRNHIVQPYGLDWLRSFAAKHNKRIAFPEWGTGTRPDGHGFGDDPLFIKNMGEWIRANDVVFSGYWDFNASDFDSEISDGGQPRSAAAFKAAFAKPNP